MKARMAIPLLLLWLVALAFWPSHARSEGVTLTVVVYDKLSRPVPGVTVYLYNETTGEIVTYKATDSNGRAVFQDLLPGSYRVVARYYGVNVGEESVLLASSKTIDLEVTIYPVVIRLTDFAGTHSLGGAELRVRSVVGLFDVKLRADSLGEVKIDKLPVNYENGTRYELTVFWQGVVCGQARVLYRPENATLPLTLRCLVFDLRIRVYDSSGRALPSIWKYGGLELPGIRVKIRHPNGTLLRFTTSTVDLSLMPTGLYTVIVEWWGTVRLAKMTVLLDAHHPGGTYEVSTAVFDVTFELRDRHGSPLCNAPVTITLPYVYQSLNMTTDGDGRVKIPMVPNGTYTITLTWQGAKLSQPVEVFTPGLHKVVFELYELTIRVRAKGAGGVPLKGALILIYRTTAAGDLLVFNGTSDEEGSVHISRIPKGYYRVEVYWRGVYVAMAYLDPAAAPIKEIACDVYRVRVQALDKGGAPLVGANVTLILSNGTAISLTSDSAGYADFGLLPAGNYRIKIEWRGVAVYDERLHLPTPNPPGDFDNRIFCPVYDLKVFVRGFYGKRLREAKVEVVSERLGIRESAEGDEIEFRQLPRGDYVITVRYFNRVVKIPVTLFGDNYVIEKTVKLDVVFALGGHAFSLLETLLLIVGAVTAVVVVLFALRRLRAEERGPFVPAVAEEEERERRRGLFRR